VRGDLIEYVVALLGVCVEKVAIKVCVGLRLRRFLGLKFIVIP